MTVEECVELSRRVAGRIWEELAIPVYLYEDAATSPDRVNLASVRKGQFEGMAEKMKLPEWPRTTESGGPTPQPGVVAVGARMPLIAYNVNLDTSDLEIANKIARSIRAAGGGFQVLQGHRRHAWGPEHRPGVHEPGQLRGHPHLLRL